MEILRILSAIFVGFATLEAGAAHAIKVTLAGEIKLGLSLDTVEKYQPTALASAALDFDAVHTLDDGSLLGGNIDLDLSHELASTTTPSVELDDIDLYIKGDLGKIQITTDGTMDKATSFLSVSEEVKGEENDLSLIYKLPTTSGFDAAFVLDVIQLDSAFSMAYKNERLDTAFDAEMINGNLLMDLTIQASFDNFKSIFFTALATDFSDTEAEAAVKLSYDFGTTEIYAGLSNYLELAGGAKIDVENLTVNADVSGIPSGITATNYKMLNVTSTKENSLKFKLEAEYDYTTLLEFAGGFTTETVGSENSVSVNASAKLVF